jgi:ketosteroid isomerase-like protein
MKASRILILEERPSPGRELRLNLLDHAVEFDFRDPAKEDLDTLDLSSYAAVVAPVESARAGLIGVLSDAKRYGGPMFLYRGEPPVHEVARWIIWGSPSHGGPDGPVADRLLAESLEYYSMASMYQQCLEMMSIKDEEKLLAQVTEAFVNALGAESCVVWLVSPSDPDARTRRRGSGRETRSSSRRRVPRAARRATKAGRTSSSRSSTREIRSDS